MTAAGMNRAAKARPRRPDEQMEEEPRGASVRAPVDEHREQALEIQRRDFHVRVVALPKGSEIGVGAAHHQFRSPAADGGFPYAT